MIYVISDGMGYGGYIMGFYPDSFVSPGVLERVVTIDIPDGSMDNYEGMTMLDSIFYVTYAPSNEIWLFDFDGDVIDIYSTPYSYPVGAAWDGCFFYLSHHTHDDVFIYGDSDWLRPWLCPASDTAYNPLDSHPPDVSLFCPDSTVNPGDTLSLHWTIDDLFWSNDECTLYVSYCGIVDTILTTDTLYDWVVPDISCDSICFRVVVRDSFCNWGYDECCVPCSTGLFAELITPPNDSIIACDDQQIIFYIYTTSTIIESTMVLIIGDNHGYYDYFSHDSTGMGNFLIDTLESMGIYVNSVSPLTDVSTLLNNYDIVFLLYDIWDSFTSEEIDSFESFIRRGGSLLSIPGAPAGDYHEAAIHNDILSLVGISYITPRLGDIDSIGVSGSHPVLDGVNSITFYKPFPIDCSDEQCIVHYGSNCIMAVDTYYSGKIFAYANEHFLCNGDRYYGSIRTGNVAADNCQLGKNIFRCLSDSMETTCPLDTSSIILTIDGIDYTIDSSEIDYTEPYLTFTPPSTDYWTSGTHTFSLHIEDTCGNTFDSSYTAIFDFDPPDIDIINHILADELDSVEIILTDTISGLNSDTGYYVIDSTDTIYYSLSGVAGTLYICPDTGWSAGEHRICIITCDDPDLCAPNCDDTCFTIIFTAILSAELITPPNDSIIACDDQPIIFHIHYDSLCMPLDTDSTMLIIDSVDTYTLDSTELYFDPAESLLQFQPDSGYWHSGWHFFQLHLQ
ncbi:hypothetical protein J7L68_01675, partial [bacterium]|nr:hypothetical protein [bacterium]